MVLDYSQAVTASAKTLYVLDFPYLIVFKRFFGAGVTNKCDKDEDSTMPKHIQRREDGRSSNFYVRLVAPTDIQPFLHKTDHVFRQSLGVCLPFDVNNPCI